MVERFLGGADLAAAIMAINTLSGNPLENTPQVTGVTFKPHMRTGQDKAGGGVIEISLRFCGIGVRNT